MTSSVGGCNSVTLIAASPAAILPIEVLMFSLQLIPLSLILVITTFALLLAGEFGRRLGERNLSSSNGNIGALEGAVLGLVTLMISFTFAMALSRFDARREAVVTEANAIGTTVLRARLLPAPMKAESIKLLREYLQLRLDLADQVVSARQLDQVLARSGNIQEQLWRLAIKAREADAGMVPTGLYVTSLNEMIDSQGTRLAHFRNRVPDIVLVMLYAISIVGIAFAGYADGLANRGRRAPIMVTALVFSVAIWLIQDLDRPNVGFLRTDVRPLIDTAAGIDQLKD